MAITSSVSNSILPCNYSFLLCYKPSLLYNCYFSRYQSYYICYYGIDKDCCYLFSNILEFLLFLRGHIFILSKWLVILELFIFSFNCIEKLHPYIVEFYRVYRYFSRTNDVAYLYAADFWSRLDLISSRVEKGKVSQTSLILCFYILNI
jgi:hypothetical protein